VPEDDIIKATHGPGEIRQSTDGRTDRKQRLELLSIHEQDHREERRQMLVLSEWDEDDQIPRPTPQVQRNSGCTPRSGVGRMDSGWTTGPVISSAIGAQATTVPRTVRGRKAGRRRMDAEAAHATRMDDWVLWEVEEETEHTLYRFTFPLVIFLPLYHLNWGPIPCHWRTPPAGALDFLCLGLEHGEGVRIRSLRLHPSLGLTAKYMGIKQTNKQ
jgi:hypothetical protein